MGIAERGIWTWGHVIYDYHGFFRNMSTLGLNKITIWNDFAPVNAREIIDEAHKYGIKVVWGFSWGWDTISVMDIGSNMLKSIKENVLKTFSEQYRDIADDGIYFQSFTELGESTINGIKIAESVVNLVNTTASELLENNPDLSIEFGLHATSIKNDLDIIAGTDRRIKIIWEDLGAFPFAYEASDIRNFDETLELTKQVIKLRGADEKCGFITKAMTKLDWSAFRHAEGPLVIGESDRDFITCRQTEKNEIWELQTKGWQKNISCARQVFDLFQNSESVISVQSLIEDGLFENEIKEPAIVFSKLCK